METKILLTFIFTFMFLQRFGLSNKMLMTSSNVTCIPRERQSLLVFKQTLKDSYNLLSTWRGVECCEWWGVGCDSQNGHVVKLDLRSQVSFGTFAPIDKQLEGDFSPSLQNLKYLRYLDLSMNNFSGNIPKFLGSFKRLEYLNLSCSGFGGVVPHHLGNLSRLHYLDLRYFFVLSTYLVIGCPPPMLDDLAWVSSLSSLRYLGLSGIRVGKHIVGKHIVVKHIDWFHPVSKLLSLHTLDLAFCGLTHIPSVKFANFTSLNSLDLSFNNINSTIPVWLSNITDLMHLNLNNNFFHGNVPNFIGMFINLASIDLSNNSFDNLIPDLLCNLRSLVHLDLSWNMFSGHIPACLWQLLELKSLDLKHNSLVGVISETNFTKLKNLNYLRLSSNSLKLNLSTRWIPPFHLQIFEAGSCNLGPHFPNWLKTQTNLRRLDISNSSIRDAIPEWFDDILSHIHYLDLSNNQISGKLPRFPFDSSSNNYIMGDGMLILNSNKFEGSLATFPSNVQIVDLSDNLLSGDVPQTDRTMNPRLQAINLSRNRFSGTIPVHLCKVTSIQVLDLSQNMFSGKLHQCLGNLINLQVMDLSNNTITGVVPSSLGSLTKLGSLHLHNNKFVGNLPLSLRNLSSLVTLDIGNNFLTGIIPFWIGESLINLRILNLQSNKFTGKIPLQICQLSALQHLNLAQNNIIGTIPHCFSNLSGMIINQANSSYSFSFYEENILASIKGLQLVYTKTIRFLTTLDLSSNNITGEIPDVLMNLVGLMNLNLSRNQLKGQIPRMIGNLSQVESLDLSMNMLFGRIPQSLTSLNFLSYLNLSFNNLSGAIPVGNQLQTLADPSTFEGNDGLCGPPVSLSCKGNNPTYNHVSGDEVQDDNEGLWFYFGIGPGFIVGFVGLLGSLHFIRRWRVAYFGMLENVYGWLIVTVLVNLARLKRKFS